MNYKDILKQAIQLFKAYMANKRGQKRVAGVASMFDGLASQLAAGIGELEAASAETADRIDELQEQLSVNEDDRVKAERLHRKLKELTA
jgi:uncharacterized phage infection (PIP) family protein YhgE